MNGYVSSLAKFLCEDTNSIVSFLKEEFPQAGKSQIAAWVTLINDVKNAANIHAVREDVIVAIEYTLPTDGMAIDLIFVGTDNSNRKTVFVVESKQWNDTFLHQLSFSNYREEGKELHPQIQVSRHTLSFGSYLDIGASYTVSPFVFMRNCSLQAIDWMIQNNPKEDRTRNIPVVNRMEDIIAQVATSLCGENQVSVEELKKAQYCPSKDIIRAMKAIVTKEDPFILTQEQMAAVTQVKKAIAAGKKIIRILGAAGSGKTAILLNLYVEYLNETGATTRPIFISGAQNTAFYRSTYPEVEASFNYSFSLDRMVEKAKGNLYVILMDEAQHNQQGIITNMVDRGATLILCYDPSQIINADNSIAELKRLEARDDFTTIELKSSVRFNGSQVAEQNIRNYLKGIDSVMEDDLFDFRIFDSFVDFQDAIIKTIQKDPKSSVAVAGLLSNDSDQFTCEGNPQSVLFTRWKNKAECEWMPYVLEKNYFEKNTGKLWVGTWWLPGLDVDYIAVIVGGDLKRTPQGVVAVPEQAKHYRMMVSLAQQMKLPENLIQKKKVFGKTSTDYFRSSKKITEYINLPENAKIRKRYIDLFSKLLRNNYYIMMTRGRKGCFVYFANDQTRDNNVQKRDGHDL